MIQEIHHLIQANQPAAGEEPIWSKFSCKLSFPIKPLLAFNKNTKTNTGIFHEQFHAHRIHGTGIIFTYIYHDLPGIYQELWEFTYTF